MLPRFPLLLSATPYESAPRLAAALGLGRLHVKREDLAGPALGGNKLRGIELILGAARAAGADAVLASTEAESNFARALAGCAPRAGMACHLILRRASGTEAAPREARAALEATTGNQLLTRLFGARIGYTEATNPWDKAIRGALEAKSAGLEAAGRKPFIVRQDGETAPLIAAAWALAAEEFVTDFDAAGTAPDLLALACSSGLTLAGLALGFAHYGLPVRLLGVSVRQPAATLRRFVAEVVERSAALLGWDEPEAMDAVTITDDQIAPGFGRPSAEGLAALRLAARCEGLVLDPVHSGKGLAGLAGAIGSLVAPGGAAAFLHTGGLPALFAQGAIVAEG